ncbi:MAG TPA: protein kinase [Gemmatimonadaceae bacterium]|nr:protein kinase [Gemmatimonadaceae bacterium]
MPTEADFPSDLRALEGEYELIRELGQGGMAAVYLARTRRTGRLVAIKAIRARYLDDPDALRRFAREAMTVADLDHPNIVRTEAIEQIDDRAIAIIMEHIPGGTARDRLREHGAFGAEFAESVLHDVASALAYAHTRGIVHRDVKPENVFLESHRGRALLSDFGIARRIDGDAGITLLGAALGTPQYMSPEQIDGEQVDGRSDIYSLGVLGWELLTGRRPWAGESLYGVIYKQKHEDLPRITSLRPRVPANLLFAIEGALMKNPAKRWQSAEEFIDRLTYNPPPVLAQEYPSGAVRADNAPTIVFRRATPALPLEANEPEPAVAEAVEVSPPPARAPEPEVALASAAAVSAPMPLTDTAEGHNPFESADFRYPTFGPNADTAFEVTAPRTRMFRSLALLGPLAIAGVSLYVVLGGSASDRRRDAEMRASGGSVAIDTARAPQPLDASRPVRPVVLGSVPPVIPSLEDTVVAPPTDSAGATARPEQSGTSRSPSRRRTASATAGSSAGSTRRRAQDTASSMPGASAMLASARDLARSDSARVDSTGASEVTELEDPFRPPTVPRTSSMAAEDRAGAPSGVLPSPRCRLAANADQRACLDAYIASGDAAMHRAFQALVSELRRIADVPVGAADPKAVDRIRVEHRAWLSVRNAECRHQPAPAEGPFWAPAHAKCFNEMAASRAAELRDAVRRLRRR